MSSSLKSTKSLHKSATLSSAAKTTTPSSSSSSVKTKSFKSDTAKNLLDSASLDNVEIEYIKNLQQQVYFLELECNYLRQQLNLNGFQSTLKYDGKSQELKSQMLDMQMEKSSLEKSLSEQNSEKETALQLLEQTERNFHKERELLLKEISSLKKQKVDLEENLINKSVELTRTQDNLEKHHMTVHHSAHQVNKIESQLDTLRKDNQLLRTEINDARTKLISRDNFIKDLQDQLNDPKRKLNVNEDLKTITNKLTMTNEALTKEAVLTQQLTDENFQLKSEVETSTVRLKELSKENDRLSTMVESSLKQNEADLLLAKKNAEQAKITIDKLTVELENEKLLNQNLKSQVEQFKLTEKLEIKSSNSLKTRIRELEESTLATAHTHGHQVKHLQDQLKTKQTEMDDQTAKHTNELSTLQSANKTLEQRVNELIQSMDNFQHNHKTHMDASKSKIAEMQSHLDDHFTNLANEKNNNKNLQLNIENFKRQEEIHNNLIASLKVRVNELDTQLLEATQREPNLMNQLREAETKIASFENEKESYMHEINALKQKIERSKQLEGLVAESIKNLSLSMNNAAAAD